MTALEKLVKDANYKHCRQVANISKIIAARAGYSADEALIIEQAALLHDVGKNHVPHEILNKKGRLTPEEYEIIKTHTEAGYGQIMDTIESLKISAAVAKEHHERGDGSGYLKMTDSFINPYAKLISAADVFDALVSRRIYKNAWDIQSVIGYLKDSNNHFDQFLVRCLIDGLDDVLRLYEPKQHERTVNGEQ